ncbi:S9 family peptidase [Catalinimonas niigatensis]|uniref:S9 family peptidase n=1 Tax=Catalinimonas niigatensis TaxID=1397264 RepID=UPI002666EAFF|nr:prolyl oligopeptidase family serine peptidase [Catalinimonas niigatensis]WPP48506.1 prolyl oligopeptidase family serine peptidase [Catalinimonas niigatensis]
MKRLLTLLLSVAFTMSYAQERTSALSIPQIMQGEDFVGHLPEDIHWGTDSRTVYFSWNPEQDTLRSQFKITLSNRNPQKVSLEEQKNIPAFGGVYNQTRSLKLYEKNGDIFLLNMKDQSVRQITNTVEREYDPQFSGDENKVIYTRSSNLFAWDMESGSTRQLSNFIKGKKEEDKEPSPYRQWLENDQLAHFDILAERKAVNDLEEERQEKLKPERPLEIFTGAKTVSEVEISPDMRFVTYRLTKSADDESTAVPDYVTQSGFVEDISARQKVGAPQDTFEMGIYDLQEDTTYTIDTEQLPGIYDKPAFLEEYHQGDSAYSDQYEEPREVIIHGPFYAEDGKAVVIVRSLDHKDRWIMRLDISEGKLSLLDRQRDEAWIGGPGIPGYIFSENNLGWIDNEHIWFQSEETAYSHLYALDVNTGEKQALTSGEYEVTDVQLSKDKKYFFLVTSEESPFVRQLYRMPAKGGNMTKLTSQSGNHEAYLSPDEKYWAIRYSFSNQPWELYLMENKPGVEMNRITNSTTDAFEAYDWREPKIIRFTAGDGVEVPARVYEPESPNGAGVIFVHGAGYLQNVHQWWSSYFREYMFHNYLTDLGYTIMDIDYRGSSGYGRDWRTAIYRHMSGKDLTDQIDGAAYMVENLDVEEDRLGIYGGSYGGFITIAALFKHPGVFQSGAALRSVTDWAHYNHPYTANILNTPVEDSIAYVRSSPIYFADGLEDRLLMLHGMVDDNVHYQDVVRLSQRLIELGKDNWDLAVFPMEPHGFKEASSWTDEYKRIFKLFEETLGEEEK